MIIQIIQGYAAGAWMLVVLYFMPSVARTLRLRASPMDIFCTLWAIVGAIQIGFSVRWYVFPDVIRFMVNAEKITWMGLYLSSGMTANMVLFYAAYHHR